MAGQFGAHVLRIPTPGGPARERNLGARTAKGDLLFFFDSDVAIPKDAVGRIAATFQDDPDLVALFGNQKAKSLNSDYLLRAPFGQTWSPGALLLAALLVLPQGANAAGYFAAGGDFFGRIPYRVKIRNPAISVKNRPGHDVEVVRI